MSAMVRIFCILLALLAGRFAEAACELSRDELLAKYVQARGGYEAIESQHALRIISIHHEGKWNPTFDYRVMKPGYMWIAAIYDDGVIIREGFDGERGWEKWGDKPAEYVGGDAHKGVNQGAVSPVHLYGLHHMESLGAEVKLLGCEILDGTEYYVLKVVSAFGTDIDYYINAKSYLLERSRTTRPLHPTQDPTPILVEERWTDFRAVDGVLHPFAFSQWDVNKNERLTWLEILGISRLDAAEKAHFAKPD